jgi:hypothetical protein
MRYAISLSVTLALVLALQAQEPAIKLVTTKPGEAPVVEVSGLAKETIDQLKKQKFSDKQWREIFRVVVAGGSDEELQARPPLAGTYSITDAGIRFEPQFPLVPGQSYIARVQVEPAAKVLEAQLALPKPPPGPRVAITGVYPSASRLPENTLRFYIHFSGEVARGDVYRHFKLIRDDGVEVKDPFLELEEELWSFDGQRLTMLFHPGRVKRELVPRQEEGPILEEGRTYTLTISEKWQDNEGRPIVAGFKKTFTAGPPDDEPVEPSQWSLMAPRSGTDTPLIVRLPKPLDHGMLGRVVWVEDSESNLVPGQMTVGGGERVLTFTPTDRWARGAYKLVTDTRLEDVCGNRVGEPFEVDVFRPITRKIETKTYEQPFTVR